jgi:hypothetical protein
MSISPVESYGSIGDASIANTPSTSRHTQPQAQTENTTQTYPPNAGKNSKEEPQSSATSSIASPLPEDEVELQRDSELENELIVRYVDKAGNVVLQVPGQQMLSVQRAIMEEFQHTSPGQEAAPESAPEGESHGD